MAYRSSRNRLRHAYYRAHTRGYGRFRGGRRRRYGRKNPGRVRTRRNRRTNRRMISPFVKKSDTNRPAHATNDESWSPINVGGATPNTFFLYCPTGRSRPGPASSGITPDAAHARFRDTVYWTGYQERMEVRSTSSFLWRRVVFWSMNQIVSALGPKKGGADASPFTYYTRQMTPIQNESTFRQFIFQGTEGIDYTISTQHLAPINRDNCKVVMDKTWRINQGGYSNTDALISKKHWYRGGRICYADNEAGNVNQSSPWSVTNDNKSRGNMYILDIFSDGGAKETTQQVGRFQCQGQSYWKES